MSRTVSIHEDLESAARVAADFVRERLLAALEARGELTLALAGGNTPRALYAHMRSFGLPWERMALCFGDERCVPPDHADSNARMVREALLEPACIPESSLHRMRGELLPAEGARDYEATLRGLFGEVSLPRFDLVLLGLGADGHTASLFPRSAALGERERWVVPNVVPGLSRPRLTLTYPVLNAAHLVVFLVSGSDKAQAVQALLEGQPSIEDIPARGVEPRAGELIFFLDRVAAQSLSIGS
jgi:6-phosphogluconolactonase